MAMIFTRFSEILLFLKKKKQKDFFPVLLEWQFSSEWQCLRHCPKDKSFLVLFFKKEHFLGLGAL
jgi:hypothetical protein